MNVKRNDEIAKQPLGWNSHGHRKEALKTSNMAAVNSGRYQRVHKQFCPAFTRAFRVLQRRNTNVPTDALKTNYKSLIVD